MALWQRLAQAKPSHWVIPDIVRTMCNTRHQINKSNPAFTIEAAESALTAVQTYIFDLAYGYATTPRHFM